MADQSSETPVLDLLAEMTAASIEATGLDEQTLMLVRFAALVAVDAPPASYLMNMGAAADAGLTPDDARDVLTAIAPIVGTARTAAAVGKIGRALGLALELAALADEEQ
ncbi:MAG TPA: carboxymuconolactone decarboxylase family protein [Gaiellaceae bacterium]|nr:carboxymuconolactone decarboxylase family protein [Gaiellaceae bacterium]